MKIRTEKVISVQDWDELVTETYKRPYSFQQQDGCKSRGNFYFKVPDEECDDYTNDSVSEKEEDSETQMGVSFSAWLVRDPNQKLVGEEYDFERTIWWERNFYPSFQMVANDLHAKGLLEAGDYTIDIDW